MLSKNILILALSLAYLAVLVHCNACKVKDEDCTKEHLKPAKKFVKCGQKECADEDTEEKKNDCIISKCGTKLSSIPAAMDIFFKKCGTNDMKEENSECCDVCIKYVKGCTTAAEAALANEKL